jgi:hypothetical protein
MAEPVWGTAAKIREHACLFLAGGIFQVESSPNNDQPNHKSAHNATNQPHFLSEQKSKQNRDY